MPPRNSLKPKRARRNLEHNADRDLILAHWRMKGVLRLPWRPALPVVTGTTTYHRDADGLIYRHAETWDMTVLQAFLYTLWPQLAKRIWKTQQQQAQPQQNVQLQQQAQQQQAVPQGNIVNDGPAPPDQGALECP